MNDSELLHAWAARRDEAAFTELVRRHLNLVHASARRQVGASPLADDIAQAVFLVLARKAGSLGPDVVLSGWLFRTTRFVTTRVLRAEQRRVHRETTATMQPADAAAIPEHWREVEPHLDAALASLSAADRDALLLRYFEGKPLRTVGERLGLNEDAARKRVGRAVDRLREWLSGRGVVLTATGLATLLANLPVGAAPAGLTVQISNSVAADTMASAVRSLAAGAIRDWWLAQVRRLLPWVATALLLLVVARRAVVHLREAASAVAVATKSEPASDPTGVPEVTPPAAPAVSSDAPARLVPSKILLSVRSSADNRPLVAQIHTWMGSRRAFLESRNIETDTNGVVEIPVTAPDVNLFDVTVTVPGFVPKSMKWKRHEFVEPVLFYQCLLDPGRTLEGVVQDEAGKPVPGAEISFSGTGEEAPRREKISYYHRHTKVSTDREGRFRSDQMPVIVDFKAMVGYVVVHPEFVPARVFMRTPESLSTNHLIMLQRGLWITGRVEDSNHVPLPGAKVREVSEAGRNTTSGTDGVFRFGPFPRGSVKLETFLKGFKEVTRTVVVGNDTDELVIRLPPDDGEPAWQPEVVHPVRLFGTVVDDESGKPLTGFQILRRHMITWASPVKGGGWTRDLLGQGHDGRFDWPVEMALPNSVGLEVVAEGYEKASSDWHSINEGGERRFEFRMRRDSAIAGRVVDLSGNPAVGAFVGLNSDESGFQIQNDGTLSGWSAYPTNSDANGKFFLRSKAKGKSLAIAHEAGFAEVTLPLTNRAPITLQPWGVIEGMVQTAGRPAPNQKVSLTAGPSEPEERVMRTLFTQVALSDSRGRFHFDHVPPTLVALGRDYTISPGTSAIGPRQQVDVQPGTTNEVVFISSGRAVAGRLVLSQTVPGHDWQLDLQKMEQALPELPSILDAGKDREEMRRRIRDHSQRRMQMRVYYPDIRPDGFFRIDDVPAGDYVLKLRISAPPNGDSMLQQMPESRVELGSLKVPVTVPAGDFADPPLDLGTITIPVKVP